MSLNDEIPCYAFPAQAGGASGDAATMRHWTERAYTALPGPPAPMWTPVLKRLGAAALAALPRGGDDPASVAGP